MSASNVSHSHCIPVEAPRAELVGIIQVVEDWHVLYVRECAPVVRYRKYVADYSRRSDRPWKIGKNSYASRPHALRALAAQVSRGERSDVIASYGH